MVIVICKTLSYNVTELDFEKYFLIRRNTLYSYLKIQIYDEEVDLLNTYTLGIDIGSTTVKIAILDENEKLLFADYERHFANIQETLADLLEKAHAQLGEMTLCPVITGSGGLTLANHLEIPFVQEVIAVSTSLQKIAPQTDVAIELVWRRSPNTKSRNATLDVWKP